jgi:hypothetical protein
MGFRTFRPDELPTRLARMVRWRWPGERLLAAVPCEAEWRGTPATWDTADHPASAAAWRNEAGLLGVTERRIVFRSLERHAIAFRLAAGTFAFMAVLGVLDAEATMPVVAAVMAVLTWLTARLIDVLGLGSGAVELGRIVEVDPVNRRIHGVDGWGVDYRLRLHDREFAAVAPFLVL